MKEKTFSDPLDPISEEVAQEMIKVLELTKKGNIMEKKTKKMTKAEAFEWLDGKKIRTLGKHETVLRKLFDLGFVWKNLRDTRVDLGWQLDEVYGLTISNDEVVWWATPHLFDTLGAEQVSLHDILSIEIVDEKYELEFNYDKVVELAKPLMHYLNEVGFRDSIRVSQLGIVHEPMSTLIFDNGIGE